jgi:hypothetical protein
MTTALEGELSRGVHTWLGGWLRDRAQKALLPRVRGERHLLFAVCDHYEPLHGGACRDVGLARVNAWSEALPGFARFRDSSGRPPRHTFFFPAEEYDPAFLEPLARLAERRLCEVEVHLHHDGDSRESLRERLVRAISDLSSHGLVATRRFDARRRPAWSFIHGNWALANGRADGRWCGVDDELRCLHELGCYADFTFPSAPDRCQPAVVNAIYYPRDDRRRRAYEHPEHVRVGSPRRDRVLLVQGPLALARRKGRGRPLRIDGAAIAAGDPPSAARLRTWIRQHVHVTGRPEWTFVKVHAHGAPERNARVLLGEPMRELYRALAALSARREWSVHYVTAREMYNVACAAMDGMTGWPPAYFDYEVAPPERVSHAAAR